MAIVHCKNEPKFARSEGKVEVFWNPGYFCQPTCRNSLSKCIQSNFSPSKSDDFVDLFQKNPFVEFTQEFSAQCAKKKNAAMDSEKMCTNKKKCKIVGKGQRSTKSR